MTPLLILGARLNLDFLLPETLSNIINIILSVIGTLMFLIAIVMAFHAFVKKDPVFGYPTKLCKDVMALLGLSTFTFIMNAAITEKLNSVQIGLMTFSIIGVVIFGYIYEKNMKKHKEIDKLSHKRFTKQYVYRGGLLFIPWETEDNKKIMSVFDRHPSGIPIWTGTAEHDCKEIEQMTDKEFLSLLQRLDIEAIRFESAAAQMEDLDERQAPVEGPVTIVKDPNSGTYSHGKYLAFPLDPENIPQAATLKINDNPSWPFEGMDDAKTVRAFWKYYDMPCGKGDTPDEALKKLRKMLKS